MLSAEMNSLSIGLGVLLDYICNRCGVGQINVLALKRTDNYTTEYQTEVYSFKRVWSQTCNVQV